jgi:predicted ATP-grasp superfamily ATP-dependent carboligase
VGTPVAATASSLADARELARSLGFPLVAKLASPWKAGSGVRSTTIVQHPGELEALQRAAAAAGAGELVLQEHLPGGPGDDWFVHGYADGASRCRPLFTGVKERAYPAHAGLTAFGTSRWNPHLADEMASLVSRVGYQGIFDLDLRRDPRDGRYKLLDFNPRLGAQFRIFRDVAGLDVAVAQYLDLTGQEVPAAEPVDGRHFVVESYDPLCAVSYWRSGELTLRAWAGSLASVDEAAWFAADDLRPFGLMCVRMGVRLATRGRGRR